MHPLVSHRVGASPDELSAHGEYRLPRMTPPSAGPVRWRYPISAPPARRPDAPDDGLLQAGDRPAHVPGSSGVCRRVVLDLVKWRQLI